MATIVHSEAAPSEAVHYTLAGAEFDLGGKQQSFETDDREVVGNAEAHPWLTVEYDEDEYIKGEYQDLLDPKDDVLSGVNSIANDIDAIRAAQAGDNVEDAQPLAVEASRDQDKVVERGGVSLTLAADDAATSDAKDND